MSQGKDQHFPMDQPQGDGVALLHGPRWICSQPERQRRAERPNGSGATIQCGDLGFTMAQITICRLLPRKSSWGNCPLVTLAIWGRKKQDENEEYMCPMEVETPKGRSSQKGYQLPIWTTSTGWNRWRTLRELWDRMEVSQRAFKTWQACWKMTNFSRRFQIPQIPALPQKCYTSV